LNNNVSDIKLKYDYKIVTYGGWTVCMESYGTGYEAVVGSFDRVIQF